ncbi:MAG: glycosyltransferase [Candidatus Eiseniibacteriota bacterium]|jgi:dolichol-phosphate mannosyltransferase
MTPTPTLSIVVPVYNEEAVLPACYERLCRVAASLPRDADFVFVNDGSTDGTARLLKRYARDDPRVRIITLSRNFGHQMAITAGIDLAPGEIVVLLDADLQDPPELIPEMLALHDAGFDVVYAQRRSRGGESLFKKATAWLFYRLMRRTVQRDLPGDVGDFRLMGWPVVQALRHVPERHRFVRGLVSWLGFRQTAIEFDRAPRVAGETRYSLWKMVRLAVDAVTSFSYVPLRMATLLGLVVCCAVGAYLLYNLVLTLFTDRLVRGWLSLITVNVLLWGVVLLFLGLLGEYVGRVYEEVKHRPLYVVQDLVNLAPGPERPARSGIIARAGGMPPATGEAPPATGEAPPATGEAPPATGEAPPATGEAPPATGDVTRGNG